ncbi:hypothetical protein P280DRAFT_482145 [Massarina eburnea CBS 473.64]|uniref:Uncharacterized protein n=1 Tax=Massarina eburnea CBS 473.64 TaxID=1395130 RepID=A0A6A6RSB7_9PLEO|nr:hypothetical protein P280DRAFT_482145 [Massarina eburnea CBS 473.64]
MSYSGAQADAPTHHLAIDFISSNSPQHPHTYNESLPPSPDTPNPRPRTMEKSPARMRTRKLPMLALLPLAVVSIPPPEQDDWTTPIRGTIQVKDSTTGSPQGCLSSSGRLVTDNCETWTARTKAVDIPSIQGDEWIQAEGSQGWLVSEGAPFYPFTFKTASELSGFDDALLVLRNTTIGGRPTKAIASQTQFYQIKDDTPIGKVLGGQFSNTQEPGLALVWNSL